MNKLEANIALLSVTMCWGVQYLFYQSIPESMSVFAYMAITNFIGLLILCAVFFREIKNITAYTLVRGLSAALLATLYNAFFITGSKILPASTASFAGTLYIVFVPVLVLLFYKEKIKLNSFLAMALILAGMWLAAGANLTDILHPGILLMLAGAVVFALYILLLDHYAKTSAPSHISIMQLLFSSIFSFMIWIITAPSVSFDFLNSPSFWPSVLVIALFIRAYSTVMQIYAQRYASPMDSSVIFSTEVVFTMLFSMCLPRVLGRTAVFPGIHEVLGCAVLVAGVIASSAELPPLRELLSKVVQLLKNAEIQKRFLISAALYTCINLCFRSTFTILPIAGPAATISFIAGILFGIPGAFGSAAGNALSDLVGGTFSTLTFFTTLSCLSFSGGSYWLWHRTANSKPLSLKKTESVIRLCVILLVTGFASSLIAGLGQAYTGLEITIAIVIIMHIAWGILIGLPTVILLTSVLGVTAAAPKPLAQLKAENIFNRTIENKTENIGLLCEELSDYCSDAGIKGSRSYNIVLSVEEMLLNIIENAYIDNNVHTISVTVLAQDIVTIRIENEGVRFNPVNFSKHPFSLRQLFTRNKMDAENLDMLGIVMVTKIAIKVEHRFKWGMNTLTILL